MTDSNLKEQLVSIVPERLRKHPEPPPEVSETVWKKIRSLLQVPAGSSPPSKAELLRFKDSDQNRPGDRSNHSYKTDLKMAR